MKLVVDANVLLAAFVKDATTRHLLLDTRLHLYAPEHLLSEMFRHLHHSSGLRKRIRISALEIQELFYLLTQSIETLTKESYNPWMPRALKLAPHQEDAPYLAVALALDVAIWSNDKGLKDQSEVKVYSTHELLKELA